MLKAIAFLAFGVGTLHSALSWNFGPHGNGRTTDPTAGPCTHLAPVARVNLGPESTLTYRYWIITGTEAGITTAVDGLIKKIG